MSYTFFNLASNLNGAGRMPYGEIGSRCLTTLTVGGDDVSRLYRHTAGTVSLRDLQLRLKHVFLEQSSFSLILS